MDNPPEQAKTIPVGFVIIPCKGYNNSKYLCGIDGNCPRAKPVKTGRVKIIEEETK